MTVYNSRMEGIKPDLGQNQERMPESVIDKHLIDEILGKLTIENDIRSSEDECERNYFIRSTDESIFVAGQLADIFQTIYDEGKTERDTKEDLDKHGNIDLSYLYQDFWASQDINDNKVVLFTLKVLLEYKLALGPTKLKKIVENIYDRWSSYVSSAKHHDAHIIYSKMRQIMFVSLQVCDDKFGDDVGNRGNELLQVEIINGHDMALDERDIDQMEEIYSVNYSDKPELQEILVKAFMKKVRTNPGEFILVRFDGDIIGYYELDNLGGKKIHFRKFNVAPGLEGVGIGNLLLDKKLNIDAKQNIILAECDLFGGSSRNYLKNGFVAHNVALLGEDIALSIVRNDSYNDLFKSKNIDANAIFDEDPQPGSNLSEYNFSGDDIIVLKSLWWTDPYIIASGEVFHRINDLFGGKVNGRKYVMTRIFHRNINPDERECATYFVFESIGDKEMDSYLNEFKQ